jgi:hypothetical protein
MGWFARLAAVAFGMLFATATSAQSYPDRPIHLLVAFPRAAEPISWLASLRFVHVPYKKRLNARSPRRTGAILF